MLLLHGYEAVDMLSHTRSQHNKIKSKTRINTLVYTWNNQWLPQLCSQPLNRCLTRTVKTHSSLRQRLQAATLPHGHDYQISNCVCHISKKERKCRCHSCMTAQSLPNCRSNSVVYYWHRRDVLRSNHLRPCPSEEVQGKGARHDEAICHLGQTLGHGEPLRAHAGLEWPEPLKHLRGPCGRQVKPPDIYCDQAGTWGQHQKSAVLIIQQIPSLSSAARNKDVSRVESTRTERSRLLFQFSYVKGNPTNKGMLVL